MKELLVPAALDKLDDVIDFVNAQLQQHQCPRKVFLQLQVAIEEIFVNIANYAYVPGTGDAKIECGVEDGAVTIRFYDSGMPYDPLKKPDPDVTLSLDERAIGGLGIFMVKKSMDAVEYEYKDGQNVLTLIKRLE